MEVQRKDGGRSGGSFSNVTICHVCLEVSIWPLMTSCSLSLPDGRRMKWLWVWAGNKESVLDRADKLSIREHVSMCACMYEHVSP